MLGCPTQPPGLTMDQNTVLEGQSRTTQEPILIEDQNLNQDFNFHDAWVNLRRTKMDGGYFITEEDHENYSGVVEKNNSLISSLLSDQKNFKKNINSQISLLINKIDKMEGKKYSHESPFVFLHPLPISFFIYPKFPLTHCNECKTPSGHVLCV